MRYYVIKTGKDSLAAGATFTKEKLIKAEFYKSCSKLSLEHCENNGTKGKRKGRNRHLEAVSSFFGFLHQVLDFFAAVS